VEGVAGPTPIANYFLGSETVGHQDNTQTRPDSWVNI